MTPSYNNIKLAFYTTHTKASKNFIKEKKKNRRKKKINCLNNKSVPDLLAWHCLSKDQTKICE